MLGRILLGLALVLNLAQEETDYRRYLPLRTDNTWTFSVSDGTTATMKVTRRSRSKKSQAYVVQLKMGKVTEEEFLTVESAGIRLWRRRVTSVFATRDLRLQEPLVITPFPPTAGRKWETEFMRGRRLIFRETEVRKVEEVKVPAGTFQALPIHVIEKTGTKKNTLSEVTTWYALDVGVVMRKIVSGGKTTILRLRESSVKAPEPDKAVAPDDARKQVSAALSRLAREAFEKEDYEQGLVFSELHRGLFGTAAEDPAGGAEEKIRKGETDPVPTTAAQYETLAEEGKALHALFSVLAKGEDRLRFEAQAMMLRHLGEHARALKEFNRYRREAGIPPCAWKYESSYACTLHTRYLAKNGYRAFKTTAQYHSEDPKNAFYTKEGHRAAGRSNISSVPLSRAVKSWLDTFYHRIGMLDPRLRSVGTGMWDAELDLSRPSLLDIHSDVNRGVQEGPLCVVYPADGQTSVDRRFSEVPELPKPVPDMDERKLGYPVTLSFFTSHRIRNVEAKLLFDGEEVPCHVSTPERPTNPDASSLNTICLLAKRHLRSATTYTVRIRCDLDGKPFSKEWPFTTR